MAIMTLQLLYNNPEVFNKSLKIPRFKTLMVLKSPDQY